ncbi:MAG: hypothetical protein OMM_01121 [Candidatus Magnetoglobus multicellularis str. Araruama]|uniref:DUF928 domain-containing protein n=1 Tax=Candidatus Magnetoglobus multicellularis str. Araruama TaxID=890399 RepID=A0A1V1PEJ6_9BACT|nr:MAG: hypothetical protein OMM_01121 [Candidatus Magnetoglobus multicellularis str. Araruama]
MAPLASLQTGYTTNPQPTLWWYISSGYQSKVELTINEYGVIEPVLETHIIGPPEEGISRINLKDHGVTLKPNAEYEWFIVIVPLPSERSADFLGSATIMYIPPDEAFQQKIENATKEELVFAYAHEGYWYDTIHHLCELISNNPDNKTYRKQRVALIDQVRLGKVKNYDKKAIEGEKAIESKKPIESVH